MSLSISLYPDQAQCMYVRPDLGPNCLQKLSADDQSLQFLATNKVLDKHLYPVESLKFDVVGTRGFI